MFLNINHRYIIAINNHDMTTASPSKLVKAFACGQRVCVIHEWDNIDDGTGSSSRERVETIYTRKGLDVETFRGMVERWQDVNTARAKGVKRAVTRSMVRSVTANNSPCKVERVKALNKQGEPVTLKKCTFKNEYTKLHRDELDERTRNAVARVRAYQEWLEPVALGNINDF